MAVERTERENAILAKLADDGRLSVSGLASDFGVSEVTIRGHLRSLEQQGMLVRTRGGARPITCRASSSASRSTSRPRRRSPRLPPNSSQMMTPS